MSGGNLKSVIAFDKNTTIWKKVSLNHEGLKVQ